MGDLRPPQSEGDTLPAMESDGELLRRLRAGDEGAFVILVERHNGAMLRLALSFVPSRAVAEEVVQDTWLAALRGLASFEGRSSLKTWLFTILVNRARTTGARESRSVPIADAGPVVDASRFGPDGGVGDAARALDRGSGEPDRRGQAQRAAPDAARHAARAAARGGAAARRGGADQRRRLRRCSRSARPTSGCCCTGAARNYGRRLRRNWEVRRDEDQVPAAARPLAPARTGLPAGRGAGDRLPGGRAVGRRTGSGSSGTWRAARTAPSTWPRCGRRSGWPAASPRRT